MTPQSNHSTNKRDIKYLLESGHIITVLSVLRAVGTIELRHYLSELRKELPIQDKWVSQNGKRFKQYWLEKKDRESFYTNNL